MRLFRKKKNEIFQNPMTGEMIPFSEVKDEMFSQKILGDGYAIIPSDGNIFAPFSGEICTCFPTGHAVGIKNKDGIEVLIHLGVDTVELKGVGFTLNVTLGDQVKQGDLLVTMDMEVLKKSGKDITSMIVFTSGQQVHLLKEHNHINKNEEHVIELYR